MQPNNVARANQLLCVEVQEFKMNAYFESMNKSINNDNAKEQQIYVNKREIIEEINRREDTSQKPSSDINLSSIFNNMKVKTKDSDIIAAKTQSDPIDVYRRIDKLEKYMSDIILNQIKIMEMLSNKSVSIHENNITIKQQIEKVLEKTQEQQESPNNIEYNIVAN